MFEGVLLAIALAMDAFAVALTQGARFRPRLGGALAIAATFGLFQAVMPLIGWGIGTIGFSYVEAVDHWIAFALLTFLGVRMLSGHDDEDGPRQTLTGSALMLAGLATSVDALAAGITLPSLDISPALAVGLIGSITFALSLGGVWLGRISGDAMGPWAERAGGVILIALGCKILASGTGWL